MSISCRTVQTYTPGDNPGAFSLLTIPPLIGDETSVRDPIPTTTRYSLNNESVEGWLSPSQKILRFPVHFENNAHLSMRIRLVIDRESAIGNLTARVEFAPSAERNESPQVLFETSPEQITDLVQNWTPVEIDLSGMRYSSGELRFVADGSLAGDPDVHLLWGEPAIYYPDDRKHRNVLLIGVDTLRQDMCSPFGAETKIMPNLIGLWANGSLFGRVWSQSPWTFPSFASMITGNYPSTIGAIGYYERIPESATTIGEILRSYGYATHISCGNPWLGNENSGFEQGIDSLWYEQDAIAADAVGSAMDFISRSQDRDWFCFLHFQDPHSDYEPPAEFADKFRDPNYSGQYPMAFRDLDMWRLEGYQYDPSEVEQVRNLYKAEVAYVDSCIGDLFNWMASNGFMDDTIIIFAADHGEEFLEHGHFGHGQSQFEVLVRTPLIVKAPGFPDNARNDVPVSNLDIVPTILRSLDIPVPENLPGMPLQDILRVPPDYDRIILGEECYDDASRFAVEWPYKCIVDFMSGNSTLYDLANDPGELIDISGSYPEIVRTLSDSMRTNMIPRKPHFIVMIVGNPDDEVMQFSGTFTVPGGIDFVRDYSLNENDILNVSENTIEFDIVNSLHGKKTLKIIVIFPSRGSYDLEASVGIDGESHGDRFFPFGTDEAASTGEASINIGEFPWPANIPHNFRDMGSALYILAIPGLDPDESGMEQEYGLDPDTIEQLRAIGYLN